LISRKQLAAFIFLASASLARADWSGWYEAAYPVTNVFRFHPTNAPLADLYAATNTVVYTNELRFGVSTTITSRFLSNVRVDDWQGPHTITNDWLYTLRRYYTNGLYSNVVYTARVVSTLVQTSLYVQARDVWAIDGYRAVRERALAQGGEWPRGGSMHTADLYTNNELFLREIKDAIYAFCTANPDTWIDHTNATWRTGTPSTNLATWFSILEWSNVVARVPGIPSNWNSYNVARELSGAGVGIGRIVTTTWVIVGSSTGIVTNTSVNTCGDAVTLTGTNRQIVSLTCTNALIEEGKTSLDYGWKFVRQAITNVQVIERRGGIVWQGTNYHWKHLALSGDGEGTSAVPALCSSIECEQHFGATNHYANFVDFLAIQSAGWWDDFFNSDSGLDSAGAAADRIVTDYRGWAGVREHHHTATGVLNGATMPTAYQYYLGDGENNTDGDTNTYESLFGRPIALKNSTTNFLYMPSMSGGAARWYGNTNMGPQESASMSYSLPACGTFIGGTYDTVWHLCNTNAAYGYKVGLSGWAFELRVRPYTILDYYASPTNGFRYR
jgi:hypothetical protein